MTVNCAFVGAPLLTSTFSPRRTRRCACSSRPRFARRTARAALDPISFVHHAPHSLAAASHLLATAATAVADGATAAAGAAADTASAVAGAAGDGGDAFVRPSGPINSMASVIESMLQWLRVRLQSAGVAQSYGLSIILFTGAVKTLTFPLNWKQMESTLKMQDLSPRIREIQSEYKDNPQLVNQMTAKLYQEENLNPLLGCLPILFQMPVWIALYRALQNLARENLLNEPFLWIPSLQGPVSQLGQGLNTWLFPFINGAPPAGWHDAAAYLVLPALLVASQIVSSRLMMPNTGDPSTQQATALNKILPIFIGCIVLNVTSALTLYMFVNNIISTAQTFYVRNQLQGASASGGAVVAPVESAAPPEGFRSNGAAATALDEEPKRISKSSKSGKTGKTGGKTKRRKRR